jgi:hypothetical protein
MKILNNEVYFKLINIIIIKKNVKRTYFIRGIKERKRGFCFYFKERSCILFQSSFIFFIQIKNLLFLLSYCQY